MSEHDKCEGGHNSTDSKSNNRRGGRGSSRHQQDERSQYIKCVVTINRVPKTVKGGRRFNFTTLAIVDDGGGMVGAGYSKTKEVPAAIQKGAKEARRNFFRVPMVAGTITYPIQGEAATGIVLLHPTTPGTGLIAGGAVRPILECAGVQDVLSKPLGTNSSVNAVHATVDALKQLVRPEEVTAHRGKSLEEVTLARMLRARAGQGA